MENHSFVENMLLIDSVKAFYGQVRDRLVTFLADTHERIVPSVLEWELTQCDRNKDIKVGEGLQYTGLKGSASNTLQAGLTL